MLRGAGARWQKAWARVPRRMRRTLVLFGGVGMIGLGGVLVVLPGPFTLPFVLGGLALMATEYAWARRMLHRTRTRVERTLRRGRGDAQ